MKMLSKRIPEANLEAKIKKLLDFNQIPSGLQYKWEIEDDYNLIADVTIFQDFGTWETPIGFIEVKSHRSPHKYDEYGVYTPEDDVPLKQLEKYQKTGLDTYYIGRFDAVDDCIDWCKELHENHS